MPAILRINPDRTVFEVVTPEGTQFGPEETDEESSVLEDQEGACFMVVFEGYEILKPNTVYRLVEVETMVEEVDEFDDDGDDDGPGEEAVA